MSVALESQRLPEEHRGPGGRRVPVRLRQSLQQPARQGLEGAAQSLAQGAHPLGVTRSLRLLRVFLAQGALEFSFKLGDVWILDPEVRPVAIIRLVRERGQEGRQRLGIQQGLRQLPQGRQNLAVLDLRAQPLLVPEELQRVAGGAPLDGRHAGEVRAPEGAMIGHAQISSVQG